VKAADESVKFTPELLPILKTAGVVDSGGKGLFILLEGILRYVNGQSVDESAITVKDLSAVKFAETMDVIEDGQEVEVVIDFAPYNTLDLESFTRTWENRHLNSGRRRRWSLPYAYSHRNRKTG